jgi:DNA-binding response OmpR family regulator
MTRVLVIDDDDLARDVLAEALRSRGCEVFELPSAIGATRVISEERVEAVVVDVMLPDIDGDKLARVLRGNARGADLAIVLVSSRPEHELRVLAVEAHADGVVSKGQALLGLWPVLQDALRRRARKG